MPTAAVAVHKPKNKTPTAEIKSDSVANPPPMLRASSAPIKGDKNSKLEMDLINTSVIYVIITSKIGGMMFVTLSASRYVVNMMSEMSPN